MEFKEAMRIWKRMCEVIKECDDCPMSVKGACLSSADMQDGSIMEAILAKWAEENPEKTIADDFFEKFPKAPRDDTNNPYPCAKDCGYSKPPYCERVPFSCDNCWRRPLEEVEG